MAVEEERPRQIAEHLGQELNESATPTPFPTRTHSPACELVASHNSEETEATMEQLNASFQQREVEEINVAVVDGSAFVPAMVKLIYLTIYLLLNLGLTLYNKEVMIKVCWCLGHAVGQSSHLLAPLFLLYFPHSERRKLGSGRSELFVSITVPNTAHMNLMILWCVYTSYNVATRWYGLWTWSACFRCSSTDCFYVL